jgi:hypothetical protein
VFGSGRHFLLGILKRFYFWLPSILLDPLDYYERYIGPRLPEQYRGGVTVLSDYFFPVLGITVLWAGFRTYHELRERTEEQIRQLTERLEERQRRQKIRETLGKFLEEGRRLHHRCSDETVPPPTAEAEGWAARAEAWFAAELDSSYISRFRSDAGLPMTFSPMRSERHIRLWGGVGVRLTRLDQFLQEFSQ